MSFLFKSQGLKFYINGIFFFFCWDICIISWNDRQINDADPFVCFVWFRYILFYAGFKYWPTHGKTFLKRVL